MISRTIHTELPTLPSEAIGVDTLRRRVLRTHGTIMLVLGIANAIAATVGLYLGAGPMTFLYGQMLGHVGLIQAYLLAALLGAVLLVGARGTDAPVKWDWIGLLLHACILPAYAFHWNSFAELGMGSARFALTIHVAFILLEGWAIFGAPWRRVPSLTAA